MSVPAFPTSTPTEGSAAARRPGPRMTSSSAPPPRARRASAPRRASRRCPRRRGSYGLHGVRAHRASSAARCDSDLSGGGASVPRSPPSAGAKKVSAHHREASAATSSSARRPAPRPRSRARSSRSTSRGRIERHVDDVDARAAERERDVGDDPGPVGHRDAQLVHLAAREAGLEQPPAGVARSRRSTRRPRRRRARPAPRAGAEARHRVVDRLHQRVGVGEVDVAPDRRRGAGDAGGVAEARAGRGQPLARASAAAAWATRTLASTCGRCETVAITRSWSRRRSQPGGRRGRRASGAGGRRARPGARGRRQVPGGAVEEVRPRVLDAGRLGARERVPADEARVATAPTSARLVEPTSVTTQSSPAAAERLAHHARQRADRRGDEGRLRPFERLRHRRARRGDRAARQRGVEHPRRRVVAAHLGAEPLARGQPDRAADQPDAEDRDDQRVKRPRAPCRRCSPRARPARGSRRSGPRRAPAGRRRSPLPGRGGSRR